MADTRESYYYEGGGPRCIHIHYINGVHTFPKGINLKMNISMTGVQTQYNVKSQLISH